MLFSSISFLYLFLPVLIVYYLVPNSWRNHVLLIASLFFYFVGEPVYVTLLIFSSLSDFFHSLYIEKHRGTKKAKMALISSIAINLGMLGFFKYTDFLIGSVNGLLGTAIPLTGVELPIGISFFTFQTMSYTIDVYRGQAKAERNLATMATFVCLFPQLVAGPIVRYVDVDRELHERRITLDCLYRGALRFAVGLGKKVLIANAMGALCADFRSVVEPSVVFYWVYAAAFALQIYFDFSGYSDMAIGLGRMFGFDFPENFDYPFISSTITEFWRRWHMTLGGWFRDYLYIPLGGNRVSRGRWIFNTAVVWAATGMWHGAAWNFLWWGIYFGVLLVLEKLVWGKWLQKLNGIFRRVYTLPILLISFVIFNAADGAQLLGDLKGMFGLAGLPVWSFETGYFLRSYAVLLLCAVVGATPLPKKLWNRLADSKAGGWISVAAEPFFVLAMLLIGTAYLVDGSFNPFLYFRF
ncbi:MAG: MBOAT family protein [Oscillospiraceae bacterium]|nr:MBOAT family protein [Oscillospiraceae bacterium]